MTTLSEAMNALRERGYTEDFNLCKDSLDCRGGKVVLYPEDFEIDKFYRFEGDSDPADQSILYAISSKKSDLKGILVNAYGIYADPLTENMLKKLNVR